jgi:hypothetical protein
VLRSTRSRLVGGWVFFAFTRWDHYHPWLCTTLVRIVAWREEKAKNTSFTRRFSICPWSIHVIWPIKSRPRKAPSLWRQYGRRSIITRNSPYLLETGPPYYRITLQPFFFAADFCFECDACDVRSSQSANTRCGGVDLEGCLTTCKFLSSHFRRGHQVSTPQSSTSQRTSDGH